MKRILTLIAAAITVIGCNRYDIDEILLQREDISLTIKGELIFSYNTETCQTGYNSGNNTFRVFEDNLANWFIIRCSTSPDTEGQVLKADIEYTTGNDTKTIKGLEFEVRKTDRMGRVWLWSDERKIGAVARRL